jgi:hypothetical protein
VQLADMTFAPLRNIAALHKNPRKGNSKEKLKTIWNDTNCAVCLFLRLKDSGALKNHKSLAESIDLWLDPK